MLKFYHTFAPRMRITATISTCLLKRKLVTALLITASLASFATLGDGGKKTAPSKRTLLSNKAVYKNHTFTLKSGFNYRGNNLLNLHDEKKYIMLNTVVTYQKGNATYILPMKKKVLLDKVTFNPAAKK
jgi:hypothetical protein